MATIKDVAKEAGVSISTVSKVLNNSDYSTTKTRAKIMTAIKKLDYRPNSIARSMVKGKANTVALVIPDVRNPFFTAVARGVEDVANKYNYRVMLCNTDEDPQKQEDYVDSFRTKIVDGFIIAVVAEDDKKLNTINQKEMPLVLIDRESTSISTDTVVVDNINGAYQAVSHLIKIGHKRIGIITGKLNTLTGKDRLLGYRLAHRDNSIEIDDLLIRNGNFDIRRGYQSTKELLQLKDRPSAIFVSNNTMTVGCLKALAEARVKIPEEIAVIGFDEYEWAEFFSPPLTVVKQPTYTMGTIAGELLFKKINNGHQEKSTIVLKPELIVRQSCGATFKK